VSVLGATLLFACNGILGLDQFDAVECNGGVCDAGTDSGVDAGVDATIPIGTAPVSWAAWRMPNYAEPGDAGPHENLAQLQPQGADIVDKVTKLAWQSNSTGGSSFAQAKVLCSNGYRLPSRIELATLLDLSRSPTINAAFAATDSASYWTSSEVRPYTAGAQKRWVVDFSSGAIATLDENAGSASVRCVRAAQ
jgi:hypothetical protein